MKLTSFNDTDMELENALAKATKDLTTLKQQYKDLEEKFDRFKYLETVVSDNGVIEKEYHITKDIVVDENGKWKITKYHKCTFLDKRSYVSPYE